MASFLQNELKNAMTLYYLIKLDKKIPQTKRQARRAVRKQGRRVHKTMKAAYKVPFYRARFDEHGLTPADFRSAEDLAKFPITTRADLREWMQDEMASHPERAGSWEVFKTSGSTGIPLVFVVSRREAACVNANWIRVLMFAGYKPFTEKMLTFLTTHSDVDPEKGDSWVQKLGILQRKIVPEHLYVGEGMRDLIALINDYKPQLICFRKNVLVRLATYARRNNLTIHKPRIYTPVSEMVDDITRKLLAETFGDGLMDAYGTNETASCAVRLPGMDAFYVYSDTHVLNIVDDEGRLSNEGRIIGTTLFKYDYPIINYEVGDRATSEMRDGLRYITSILGRSNDLVLHEDGTETSATELMKIPNGIDGISQFRYVQESTSLIRVLLVKDPRPQTSSKEQIEEFFSHKVEELFGRPEFELSFEWLDEIPPDKNGKMRCFLRNF